MIVRPLIRFGRLRASLVATHLATLWLIFDNLYDIRQSSAVHFHIAHSAHIQLTSFEAVRGDREGATNINNRNKTLAARMRRDECLGRCRLSDGDGGDESDDDYDDDALQLYWACQDLVVDTV